MGNKIKQTIEDRAKNFAERLRPYLDSEGGKYSREMLNEFWKYWTEYNEGGLKMRYEMQKIFNLQRRLNRWHLNQQKYEFRKPTNSQNQLSDEQLVSALLRTSQEQPSNGTNQGEGA